MAVTAVSSVLCGAERLCHRLRSICRLRWRSSVNWWSSRSTDAWSITTMATSSSWSSDLRLTLLEPTRAAAPSTTMIFVCSLDDPVLDLDTPEGVDEDPHPLPCPGPITQRVCELLSGPALPVH